MLRDGAEEAEVVAGLAKAPPALSLPQSSTSQRPSPCELFLVPGS